MGSNAEKAWALAQLEQTELELAGEIVEGSISDSAVGVVEEAEIGTAEGVEPGDTIYRAGKIRFQDMKPRYRDGELIDHNGLSGNLVPRPGANVQWTAKDLLDAGFNLIRDRGTHILITPVAGTVLQWATSEKGGELTQRLLELGRPLIYSTLDFNVF